MKIKIEKENKSLLQVIAYICYIFAENSSILNSIKLNKILWFADVKSLYKLHKTITEKYEYIAQDTGPVLLEIPKIMRFLAEQKIISFLGEKKDLSLEEREYLDSKQAIYIIKNSEELKKIAKNLSEEDKGILDSWIRYGIETRTKKMIARAHNYDWWSMIANGETIPVHLGHIGLPKEEQSVLTPSQTSPK